MFMKVVITALNSRRPRLVSRGVSLRDSHSLAQRQRPDQPASISTNTSIDLLAASQTGQRPAPVATTSRSRLGMGEAIGIDSDLHQLHRLAVNQSEPFWAWRRKLQTGGRTENLVRRVWRGNRGP
jgi:hypothetical protein